MTKFVKAWFFGRSFGKTVLSRRFSLISLPLHLEISFHPTLVPVDSSDCFLNYSCINIWRKMALPDVFSYMVFA